MSKGRLNFMKLKKIKELAQILEESNLKEISYEDSEFKVKITKGHEEEEKKSETKDYIKSPLVGTFFHVSPRIKIGERVKKGQTVCIINSMKVMNEISSPVDGIVKEIKFSDNDKVSVNDDLILIEKL